MAVTEWPTIHTHIVELEREGLVTRTFRRLDPDRQTAVVSAILDEAAERGPDKVNIKLVAGRAGISVGALYTYFHDRDTMISFIVALCIRYMHELLEQARPYLIDLPFRDAIRAYVAGGIEWAGTQDGMIKFFARAAYGGPSDLTERVVRPVADEMLGVIREMVSNAGERGEVRTDVDSESLARFVHGILAVTADSMLLRYLDEYLRLGSIAESSRLIDTVVTLVCDGVMEGSA
jgi:AcrR family transcriptional regulator